VRSNRIGFSREGPYLLAATPDRVGAAFRDHAQGGVEVGDAGTDVTADGVALAA
jgi:hypothetical protein